MAQDRWPLSDLSFFRFPELTGDVVRNIVMLVLLLAATILVTIALQTRIQRRLGLRSRRERFDQFAGEHRMPAEQREVLQQLMHLAGAADEFRFVHDAETFERAVDEWAVSRDEADLLQLAKLRRTLHLNVMNPEIGLVSTRQLLADLPVRLVATIGEEKLDLYCALLRVDEDALLIELPPHEEIYGLLQAHPDVFLLHWREREGEAVFRIALEPIEPSPGKAPEFAAFRARHAFRDAAAEQRSAFRLSVDLPATYRFLERSRLGRRLRAAGPARPLPQGEGRLIDLSYGGASLIVDRPLEERGLAQLAFELHGRPVRLMLEVLSREPMLDGRFLLRGQFRGLGEEARVRLNNVLHREQLKRLRDREILRVRTV